MKLAAPVQHPDHPDQVLLRAGYVLEPDVIRRMHDLRIATVVIDYPALEELDKHIAPYLSPARQMIYSQIKQSISAAQRGTQAKVDYRDYCNTTRDLVETLMLQGKNPLFLDQVSRMGTDSVGHATSVAHLALLLGIKLESYLIEQRKRLPPNRAKDIVSLGVAGMLHDLGKAELPIPASNSWETSPPESAGDLELYQSHAQRGYEQIHGEVEPTAAAAVLNHHQHFDGTGFPTLVYKDGSRGTWRGQRIHIFSRILQVADLYDRLGTTDTGARRSNLEIYFQMRTSHSGWSDPVIVQMLQQIAPPFPPGCRLVLADGTQAVVTQINGENPYKPVVRRLAGEDLKLDGDPIDLGQSGAPSIVSIGRTPVEPYLPIAA
jgi:HD-GYP domain-containing protein (c-di-GMP phosphodiesterase class II)